MRIVNAIRWALVRLLLPSGRIEGSKHLRVRAGPVMICIRPMSTKNLTHDAVRAFHCGDRTIFCYEDVEEWKS